MKAIRKIPGGTGRDNRGREHVKGAARRGWRIY